MLVWPFFRWLEELPDMIRYWGLPRGCWHCEVLGLCRRPKEEGWKCYNGCRVINEKREQELKEMEEYYSAVAERDHRKND